MPSPLLSERLFSEIGCEIRFRQAFFGDSDHKMIETGILEIAPHSIGLKERHGCGRGRPLVAIEKGLSFGNMKSIRRSDIKRSPFP
jgi:hypothetical protein